MNAPLLDIKDLLTYLPHRYPFLLVDRITEIVPNESVHAYKNVTFNEPFFLGHFPNNPVMPGVLILEALAQAGGVMVLHSMEREQWQGKMFLFTAIDKTRFRSKVVPGDRLDLEARLVRQKLMLWKLACVAKVDGKMVAEAELTAAMIDAGV